MKKLRSACWTLPVVSLALLPLWPRHDRVVELSEDLAPTASPSAEKPPAKGESAIGYRYVTKYNVPMHIVQIDLSRPEVRFGVVTPEEGIGRRDGWSKMIDRSRPSAAITGTYFDTVSSIPIGSIIVNGRQVHYGTVGTAFTHSRGAGAQIISASPRRYYDWTGKETVLRAGPRLLTGGRRTLWPRDEGFKDPAVYAKKKRTAIAITHHGKMLLVATEKPVLLRDLAEALKKLGALDAMCLDGGGSTGLYFKGKSHVVPRRELTNLLVVYESPERYEQHLSLLNP
jgi:exopolysaccharide biosynthesis protein